MKNLRTNYTSPKRNIIAAANDLRKCLALGHKAHLIRISNEDCQFPILKNQTEMPKDFREYQFSYATIRTKAEIQTDQHMSDFEKYLSLNYISCFGTQEAVDKYYQTSVLGADNLSGMGKSHLVKVTDLIETLQRSTIKKDRDYARLFYHYHELTDDRHFYDTFKLKNIQERQAKSFKHKLYVVEMLENDEDNLNNNFISPLPIRLLLSLLSITVFPFKYIPKRSILLMPNYKIITYRVGDVCNGYSIEIQIPKKFSLKSS